MDGNLLLVVMSPEKTVEECSVEKVTLPGKNGKFEILRQHAPIISSLDAGDIEYLTADGENKKISIKSGFVEVRENKVSAAVEL